MGTGIQCPTECINDPPHCVAPHLEDLEMTKLAN